jgi:hypothetical protein
VKRLKTDNDALGADSVLAIGPATILASEVDALQSGLHRVQKTFASWISRAALLMSALMLSILMACSH